MQTDKPHISTWGFVQSLLQSVISSVRKPERYSHPIFLDDAGMRITIMHGQEIFAEYDLISKRWFTGEDITNKHYWKQSMMKYRLLSGFEQHHEIPFPPGEIFAIADLHFGHANIIRYCSRPFEYNDVKEMDEVLIQNWNSTVGKDHCIFFCGDLSWGKDSKSASDYLSMLNGRITCIPGNHDTGFSSEPEYQVLEHEGLSFCLVHDPERAPKDFCGWVVHGHHHNNDLESYPFFHPGKRRINVSAEVVGYTPVPFSELVRLIRERGDKPGEIVYLRYPYIQEYGENLQDNGTSQAI
jgi:calcineurin-like phosphoesterase family protein